MKAFFHYITTYMIYAVAALLASVSAFFLTGGTAEIVILFVISAAAMVLAGWLAAKFTGKTSVFNRYFAAWLPFTVGVLTWAIAYSICGGSTRIMMNSGMNAFAIAQIPMFPALLIFSLYGSMWGICAYTLSLDLVFAISFTEFMRHRYAAKLNAAQQAETEPEPEIPERESRKIGGGALALIITICSATAVSAALTAGFAAYHYSKVLPPDYGTEYGGGYSSVDLWDYNLDNPENVLPRIDSPSFTIADPDKMPVLDGAEAAYPVYSAFALACYDNEFFKSPANNEVIDKEAEAKDEETYGGKVTFTNTIYAFERLVSGEVDVFFGAQPSNEQKQLAADNNVELVLTPIGKEAFVFFTSKDNTVDSLTVEQIRDIYSGKITNWSQLGGSDEKIAAFQRPKNSGSQTLLEHVMGDTPLMPALKEEYSSGMGDITEAVADYRNNPGSIGYSFRFFLCGMTADADDVKLVSVNGTAPTPETISDGSYPFTVNLYAITVKSNPLDTLTPFLEWMQSPQAQDIVSQIGYVPLG